MTFAVSGFKTESGIETLVHQKENAIIRPKLQASSPANETTKTAGGKNQ